ncbi:mitochondrial carrier [Tilletiaria anomala UBC 951]|uniref:Mitochondrial carrier n=1 Tax=Tilletiaria anomala (strain ATCC 24038 / CBS 436.72 / UBC 951) TaxID=1037660 RepID=A0A066WE26_TILAU|nr:mitochondrial carrier [Tilletiaria anomala UBC 951]KDN52207.1 mitochondrial carrier [Tilletiaria anomala UBC 951]
MASAGANTAYNALAEAYWEEQRVHARELGHKREQQQPSSSSVKLQDEQQLTPTGRKPVSRSRKAIAACTGAITTSFLMTPFDVVKTRLQMQTPPETLFVPSQHLPPPTLSANAGTAGMSEKAFGKQRAVPALSASAVAASSSNPATCCQPTFFLDNAQKDSLACRYDPRLDRTTSSFQALAGSHAGVSGSSSTSVASASGRLTRQAATSSYQLYSSTSVPQHLPRNMKSASTCAFPDRAIAQRILQTAGPLAYLDVAATAPQATTGGADAKPSWSRLVSALQQGGHSRRAATSSSSSTSFTTPSTSTRLTGIRDGFVQVGRREGIKGLWRGLTPTLAMTIPSQVTYMTCYDFFRAFFLSLEKEERAAVRNRATYVAVGGANNSNLQGVTTHTLLASLAAGALSRALSATLVTPLELVRTRLQASSSLSSSNSLGATLTSLRAQVTRDGVTVLWRGLGSTLWRDVPFSAIYFTGYEAMKRALTGGGLGEGNAKGQREEFIVAFVSGATSGTVAAIATHPFDLIKTRLQASAGNSDTGNGTERVAQLQAQRPQRNASARTVAILRHIYTMEGMPGLFRGLSPRVAKVAPACGVMIASFEVVGRFLADL